MSTPQEVLIRLLDSVPVNELASGEHRTTFEQIRQRIASASDLHRELQDLYKVKGLSDFALSLMWSAHQVEKDPSITTASPADVTLVFSSFRRAMGESEQLPSSGPSDVAEGTKGAAPSGPGDVSGFSALLEQLVEAVQGGDEQRIVLLEDVVNECEAAAAGDFPDDYREFCRLLAEFLRYVAENLLLDDIRVLNILANIPSPVAQWAKAAPLDRMGLLEEEIGVLRDFKSHFE